MFRTACSVAAAAAILAAPLADLVAQVPGFEKAPFKVYSGYLNVSTPSATQPYDQLVIHYQLHESLGDPTKDPLVTWHQGGPGGNSMYGQYGEMGYFQVDDAGTRVNPYSWNRVANMLYLESPAGSDDPIGFSYCIKDGKVQNVCAWNDVTQAEAYAHTLQAFLDAFPEYQNHALYLSGESYAGQYLPNIAHYIVNDQQSKLNLKGILVGNGCWGGDATHVQCNGPNAEQNDIDMYYGKGLISKALYDQINTVCEWPKTSLKCLPLLEKAAAAVGPHNVYDIYDNCPQTSEWLARSGKSMRWLKQFLRDEMDKGTSRRSLDSTLQGMSGGFDWGCDALNAMAKYFRRDDVQKALHLGPPGRSGFRYTTSGPASVTLYPELIKKLRVLIYNGDADACVPYKGNEEWTTALAAQGLITETKAWHPWFVKDDTSKGSVPAGYSTVYSVNDSSMDFSFVTIRLSGHMVPAFTPSAALGFFSAYLAGGNV